MRVQTDTGFALDQPDHAYEALLSRRLLYPYITLHRQEAKEICSNIVPKSCNVGLVPLASSQSTSAETVKGIDALKSCKDDWIGSNETPFFFFF